MKRKNVVQLAVDNMFASPPDQFGRAGTTSITMSKSLYIGGNPIYNNKRPSNSYLGCIKNVEIIQNSSNERHDFKKLPTQVVHGNVTLSVCPTI